MNTKTKAAYIEGIVSIIINTGLFFIKFWAGIASGSIALIADAWHTLSDSASSVVVIAGTLLSTKKPDKEHPFGHGRWEQITAIFIGFMLGLIAWDFLNSSIERFQTHESANYGVLAIVVTIISIVVKEGLAQYAFYIYRKTQNLSVKADAWHHRTDALSSVIVLVGLFFSSFFWWIDSVLGIIISLMLFYAAYDIIKDAILKILGEEPSEELILKVQQIVQDTHNEDLNPHHYHIHNYVSHKELTFHIKVSKSLNVVDAHSIATKIEKVIKKQLNIEATLHIEPDNCVHE